MLKKQSYSLSFAENREVKASANSELRSFSYIPHWESLIGVKNSVLLIDDDVLINLNQLQETRADVRSLHISV